MPLIRNLAQQILDLAIHSLQRSMQSEGLQCESSQSLPTDFNSWDVFIAVGPAVWGPAVGDLQSHPTNLKSWDVLIAVGPAVWGPTVGGLQ